MSGFYSGFHFICLILCHGVGGDYRNVLWPSVCLSVCLSICLSVCNLFISRL